MDKKIQKQNIGNAGKYYIASRLSAQNFTTTITLKKAENFDILSLSENGRSIKISVKTRIDKESSHFTLNKKVEKCYDKDFFYIFVRLYKFEQEPCFWVIPSKIVSKIVTTAHKKWLSTTGKKNQKRNDTNLRKLPIILKENEKDLYPKNWEKELKKYYKNTYQLL